MSALSILFLLFDGAVKFTNIEAVVEANARLGYAMSLAPWIGTIELVCTVVYLIPRTAILGAILLTAHLGGATAAQMRTGDYFFFPIVIGLLIWGGLWLRDDRLRALIPVRREGR